MEDVLKEYKQKICTHCIHNNDENYTDCNIIMQIDGKAKCLNYKRKK